MSVLVMDCSAFETSDQTQSEDTSRMRYDLIVHARQKIRDGHYDNDAVVGRLLDLCMEHIVEDTHNA